jgi:hypothetical protein
MSTDEREDSNHEDTPAPSEDAPQVEDAYAPDESTAEEVLEDEPELLDPALRSLEAEPTEADVPDESAAPSPPHVTADTPEKDDAGDTDAIADEPEGSAESVTTVPADLDDEVSPRRVAVELKRVEVEVRELLEGLDGRRKRKLTGTRRWRELEEDILSWHYSGRFDEETLGRLRRLIARRHYLFRRLQFLAGTRPVWNT